VVFDKHPLPRMSCVALGGTDIGTGTDTSGGGGNLT